MLTHDKMTSPGKRRSRAKRTQGLSGDAEAEEAPRKRLRTDRLGLRKVVAPGRAEGGVLGELLSGGC